jgi:hypothetical protein
MYLLLHKFNKYPYWIINYNTKQMSSNILQKIEDTWLYSNQSVNDD